MDYKDSSKLQYFLFKNFPDSLGCNLIVKSTTLFNTLEIEIAIIGGSHYFFVKNNFVEVLTCSEIDEKQQKSLMKVSSFNNFELSQKFETFEYQIKIENIKMTKEKFYKSEKNIIASQNTLIHCFADNSAITALEIKQIDKTLTFETLHTYPETYNIVKSVTSLFLSI